MELEKRAQLGTAVVWTVAITVAHFALGTRTHAVHGGHILLGSLYMFPILSGAVAFGVRGGILTSLGVCLLYIAHILVSWAGRPMGNPDQYAMLGAYLFVGVSAGGLVRQANRRKWERDQVIMRSARSETIRGLTALAAALGARDPETLRHSERVADLCDRIAAKMGLSKEEQEELRLAALVHDIGKIGAPDDVLFYNGQFDEAQRARMHEHPAQGAALIRSIFLGERIAAIVESHHEQPDGAGYPKGLSGDQIPLPARILRVADVYDALAAQRRYKDGMGRHDVLAAMRSMAGTKFDIACFEALTAVVDAQQGTAAPRDTTTAFTGAESHG